MKVEALNCPNCGAAVVDESATCSHCRSRLKTMSCTNCFGIIFVGAKFCPLCGAKAMEPERAEGNPAGDCPRCRKKLAVIEIAGVTLRECGRCAGVWSDTDTFETICREKENQSAVISKLNEIKRPDETVPVRYVPCPDCGELMNRSNFARISGVIIDTCKPHGLWFDATELPRIIEFIDKGGLDTARRKEKLQISEERARLKDEQFKAAVDRLRGDNQSRYARSGSAGTIREIISFLFD